MRGSRIARSGSLAKEGIDVLDKSTSFIVDATARRSISPLNAALRLVSALLCMALCGCRSTRLEVAPACAKPAPLEGKYDRRAPGYFIELNGTAQDFWPTVGRWEREYSLHITRN